MRFRHTILCLAVALSCVTHGSDMAYGQSPAFLEAQNRYTTFTSKGGIPRRFHTLPKH